MKMLKTRRPLLFALLFLLSFKGIGQRILPQIWFNENNIRDSRFSVGDGSKIYGLSGKSSEENLDYYWEKTFQDAMVYFYPQELKSTDGVLIKLDSLAGIPVRFDLWNNRLEIKTSEEIKVIGLEKVSNLILKNEEDQIEQFINPKEFGLKEVKGLLLLLGSANSRAILCSKELLIQSPTYNAALDTGTKEATVSKKAHFYFWDGQKALPIDSKKEVIEVLDIMSLDSKKYFKESGNKLKSESDYRNLAHFLFHS